MYAEEEGSGSVPVRRIRTNMTDYDAARRAEAGRYDLHQDRPYNFGLDIVDRWTKVEKRTSLFFLIEVLFILSFYYITEFSIAKLRNYEFIHCLLFFSTKKKG